MARVQATINGTTVSADLRELAPSDRAREAPATHKLVSLYLPGVEPGAAVEIEGAVYTVTSARDPADALLAEVEAILAEAALRIAAMGNIMARNSMKAEADGQVAEVRRRHAQQARRFLDMLLAPAK